MAPRQMSRSERLLQIEQMLARSSAGLRAVELASACDVDRRTVYRDLALLNELGVPMAQKDGRFFINREAYRAPLRLSCDEALSLLIAAAALSNSPNVHTTSLTAAIDHLSQVVPEPIAVHVGYLGQALEARRDPSNSIFDQLTRAWSEHRCIQLWYLSRDKTKLRTAEIAIYFIEPRDSVSVYVVGYDTAAGRIRAFKLSRIRRVELKSATYQIPSHFDPRPFLARLHPRPERKTIPDERASLDNREKAVRKSRSR